MFTLATNPLKQNRQAWKTMLTYLALSVLCLVVNRVYALFGHGVTSDAMSLMFLYPLLGGVLPFGLLWLTVPRSDQLKGYRFLYNCYNSGLAVLTVRSLLYGVFEIAGTASPCLVVFAVGGWLMVITGMFAYLVNLLRRGLTALSE